MRGDAHAAANDGLFQHYQSSPQAIHKPRSNRRVTSAFIVNQVKKRTPKASHAPVWARFQRIGRISAFGSLSRVVNHAASLRVKTYASHNSTKSRIINAPSCRTG